MSETGEAKAEVDTVASGVKSRPEGRVCERGWWPTRKGYAIAAPRTEAARRLAIAHAADTATDPMRVGSAEAA